MYLSGSTHRELMQRFSMSNNAVINSAKRLELPLKRTGRPRWREFSETQTAEILSRWDSGESVTALVHRSGSDRSVIIRLLREFERNPVKRANIPRGSRSGAWKGGRVVASGGYTWILMDISDPFWSMSNNRHYVPEHRIVMARHLGRPLTCQETVHHINGDKTDNSIGNLQLRQGSHGHGKVMMCLDCGSNNVSAVPIK